MKLRGTPGAFAQLILFAALAICPPALAQNQSSALPPSDLARQNMERVAASASQIDAILHKDPGLLVELKRWVAKDATDHGQLISDSDLTDQAIYNRLETDVAFRSVATTMLQKFGYLLPQVNPDSPQAKEQAILIQERAKWQAQDEEQQLTEARQRPQSNGLQQTQTCDPGRDVNCKTQPGYPVTQQPAEFQGPVWPQSGFPAGNPSAPAAPQRGSSILERAELNQGAPEQSSSNTALALDGLDGSALPMLTGLSLAGPGTLSSATPVSQPQILAGQSPTAVLGLSPMANPSTNAKSHRV